MRLFRPFLVIAAVVTAAVFLESAAYAGPPGGKHPAILKTHYRGRAAIAVLGRRLSSVAREHRMSVKKLRKIFVQDRNISVDTTLRLYVEDPPPAVESRKGAAEHEAAAAEYPQYPLSDTFLLHSKAGSKRVIYLDFDGELLSGLAWNANYNGGADINAPAWTLDGDASTFNDSERTAIQAIWKRVAEDYAPFDVDVTTEYPGEDAIVRTNFSDEFYGTRVLISPISSYFGNYGGIAWVGVFDNTGAFYKPALVFPEKLSNGAKFIAEASSHETGHNLGLSHDGAPGVDYYSGQGSGETGWAPIMGNSYSKNLTQWSKGEYANANNTEDDLAVMQANGAPRRADDHGNTTATATVLQPLPSVAATGILESATDVDLFRLTVSAYSILTVTGDVAETGPNADLSVTLLDSSGSAIALDNAAAELEAGLSMEVAAGTYYLKIDGVGKDSPSTTGYSDYASLGQYYLGVALQTLNVTPTPTPIATNTPTPAPPTPTSIPTAVPTATNTPEPTATSAAPTPTNTPVPTATPARAVRIGLLSVRTVRRGVNAVAQSSVRVVDVRGLPAAATSVTVGWTVSGQGIAGTLRNVTARTNAAGVATFESRLFNPGRATSISAIVRSASKSGYVDSARGATVTAAIALPPVRNGPGRRR